MKEQSLKEAITEKIEDMGRLRYNRINASERLKNYQDTWDLMFFLMNTLAVILLVLSNGNYHFPRLYKELSTFYTLYTLMLQYYINSKNYSERSLRFHYQELEVEKFIIELKNLRKYCREGKEGEEDDKKFSCIIKKYIIEIRNTENHSSIDDDKTKFRKSELAVTKLRDYSADMILILVNRWLVVFPVTIYTIWICLYLK